MMPKQFFPVILLFILIQTELYSQQYFFRNFSVEQGLPQSSVYCLLQDSRGFVWMGTSGGGVARFDGLTFETFTKASGLSDDAVRTLFEDSKGNIWIGTDNGLTIYDGFGFKIVGTDQGLKGSSVLKFTESGNGIIWAATNDGGLSRIIPGDSVTVTCYTKEEGLVSNFIFDIYEDAEKRLWLGMVGGVNIIEFTDSSSLKIKNIYKPDINSESVAAILSIEPAPDGTIWFGSYESGLFSARKSSDLNKLSLEPSPVNDIIPGMRIPDMSMLKNGELWLATDKNGVIRVFNDRISGVFNKESGLQSNQITGIMEDKEGNIWFASFDQGAMMYADNKFISYNENHGIKGNQVLDILFAPGNTFYIATEEGLMQFKKEGLTIRRLKYFTSSTGLNAQGANTVARSYDGRIMVGTGNGINILSNSGISNFRGNFSLGNKDISSLVADRNKNIWVGTAGGYGRIFGDKLFFMDQDNDLINNEIQTIIEDKKGRIWIGTLGGLVRLDGENYTSYADFDAVEGLTTRDINSLVEDPSGNILIGTIGGGIFKFNTGKDSMPVSQYATKGILASNTINSLQYLSDTLLIAGNNMGFDLLIVDKNQNIRQVIHNTIKDGFPGGENIPNSISTDSDGYVWFGTKDGLVRYDPASDLNYSELPEAHITGVKLFFKDVDWGARDFKINRFTGLPRNLVLSHSDNHLTFTFTGLSYRNPEELEFSYFLENQGDEWSPFSADRDMPFSGLTPGSYTFKVKARNKFGLTGNTAEFKFVIRPPFWQTPWFLIPAAILLVVLFIIYIRIRESKLIREKIKLENIVEERTREVVEQKDEIARQRDVVTYQKKEITDSIHYAERIQRAVLPEETILKNSFADYFILFRPKDIVSGDFYWMSEKSDHIIFTAADCTGHGVPGAFMSMLGVSFLNKIVNESGIVDPSKILNSLRENIIYALKQEGAFDAAKDGMDISLCSVSLKKMKLWFAGANNPMIILRKNGEGYDVIEVKADKMPIGIHSKMESFVNHEVDIVKGDTIYLFSDGFLDQFGGPAGRKFMKPRLKEMLQNNQHLDMASQKTLFNNTMEEWIHYPAAESSRNGQMEQIDDIILIGVRI